MDPNFDNAVSRAVLRKIVHQSYCDFEKEYLAEKAKALAPVKEAQLQQALEKRRHWRREYMRAYNKRPEVRARRVLIVQIARAIKEI